MITTIKAAIFDLDGTLIDSMYVWEKIDIDYLRKHGLTPPDNLKDDINHLSFQQTAQYFKDRFKIEDSLEAIMSEWNDMAFNEYSNNVKLKNGVLPFLKYLKNNKIKIALATSNSIELLTAALKNTGIYDYFHAITTTDEAGKSKNNPDIYLLSSMKLGVSPSECVVFEDIVQAVQGAKKAGMKVIAVNDKASEYQKEDLIKICDNYIYDFKELIKE